MLKPYADKLSAFVPTVLRIMAGITFFAHSLGKIENIPG